ncbi:MAG: hypothetical protein ABIJ48_11930 [Actinomycetota bacterium]
MIRTRKVGAPVLVGLLAAVLLTLPGASGKVTAAEEPRLTIGKIMIPAAAFVPISDNPEYANYGVYLTGPEYFVAPVSFPVQEVKVRKITLYAVDSTSGTVNQVCARLERSAPARNPYPPLWAGGVCTSDITAYPQVVATTAISPRTVNAAFHSSWLYAYVGSDSVQLFTVQITYIY